jgi:hypothetical protein
MAKRRKNEEIEAVLHVLNDVEFKADLEKLIRTTDDSILKSVSFINGILPDDRYYDNVPYDRWSRVKSY